MNKKYPWAVILSTWVLLFKRMGRSIVMSTIGSKPAGWNGGANRRVLCDHNIPLWLKGKFYRIAIRPVVLYGTECWVIKRHHAQKTSVAEMRMLCWMCGNTPVSNIGRVGRNIVRYLLFCLLPIRYGKVVTISFAAKNDRYLKYQPTNRLISVDKSPDISPDMK